MSTSAITPMSEAGMRRGAVSLTAAGMVDFTLQLLLPVVLVRLLPASAFADYRLAWLAIGTAMAVAPLALPRSLFYFLPRAPQAQRPAYVHNTLLLLLASGSCAGLLLGPWNTLLPDSLRHIAGGAWFLPAFLSLWVAASLAEFLPSARGDAGRQAVLIVALACLRVAVIALAALSGRVDVVFGALLAYAAFKLALVLADVRRHYRAPPGAAHGRHAPHGPGLAQPRVLRTQLAYALPFGLGSALFLLRGQADQWVAATLFTALAFAAFSIGAVIMPLVALVRTSIANTISARLSRLESQRERDAMLRLNQRANLAAAFVLLPTLALTAVLAEHIVTLVYTPAFIAAADVMRINCLALVGVAVEVSTLTMVLNQGRFLLAADALLLPVGVAGAAFGATLWGLPGAALGNMLTLAAGNAFSFWRVSRATGVPLAGLQRCYVLLRIFACAVAAALLTLLFDHAAWIRAPLPKALAAGARVLRPRSSRHRPPGGKVRLSMSVHLSIAPAATAPIRLLFVFGTRPEAIKLAPLVLAARAQPLFKVMVCVTAQHRDMLDSVLAFFHIQPDLDLDLMTPGQTLTSVTTGALGGLEPVLDAARPDWMVVQGDTTSAFAAALAAFYAGVPVAHVEAGLRTGNIFEPFPEEMNRRLLGAIAGMHFPPTVPAAANLLREGVPAARIQVTGNTGIDALYLVRERLRAEPACRALVGAALAQQGLAQFSAPCRPFVLVTAHRRESSGAGFDAICSAIGELCARFSSVDFVFPVHPDPAVRGAVERHLQPLDAPNLALCRPLDYLPFVALMLGAALVLTDSGGVQEEAPSLGKPVVVMRELTEPTEGTASGMVHLAGAHHGRIVSAVTALLEGGAPSGAGGNFYSGGHASGRILDTLANLRQRT